MFTGKGGVGQWKVNESMDLSILTQNKVAVMTLDQKYLPTAIVLPFEGHARQSKLMHAQVNIDSEKKLELWMDIIRRKIHNQAGALSILGLPGSGEIAAYAKKITKGTVDQMESLAARDYFSFYHGGLKRRTEDPVNSRLNYGYAVVRSNIARSLTATRFHPTFGIHHNSQLNSFNLADDLIEPFRPMVDLIAHKDREVDSTDIRLTRDERRALAHILHNACMMDGMKMNVMTAIDRMCESLKRIILEKSEESLKLPDILPVESMEGITE